MFSYSYSFRHLKSPTISPKLIAMADDKTIYRTSVTAPVNIAVIK